MRRPPTAHCRTLPDETAGVPLAGLLVAGPPSVARQPTGRQTPPLFRWADRLSWRVSACRGATRRRAAGRTAAVVAPS
ncbi:MAG TPA: hypothetical protein PKC18_05670 [Lacipirellulaceae bacterium]|nr:hypothetical protein [Lacipirellulaceae bacterium]